MLAPPTISVPFDPAIAGLRSVTPTISTPQELSAPPRFPHTRAQLTSIARQYRPLDNYDDENDDGSSNRITSAFVARVASLLDEEREDELKMLLKDTFGPSIDDEELSQHVLDLMHRHRDDLDGVPFVFLTPTRRPISRPSSRASTHSARLMARPDTPNSAPSSPLAMVFRRPHTPLMSPLASSQQASSYMTAHNESPGASPTIAHAQFTASLPSSPLSSPRILNAKAHEFKPIPRPLSAASSNPASLSQLRGETPSPDMWAQASRPTSKLAIAAPLTPDSALLPRSGTPSSLRLSLQPEDEDEEDDPFDPFAPKPMPRSFHPVESELSQPWSNSSLSSSSLSTDDAQYGGYYSNGEYAQAYGMDGEQYDPDTNPLLTDGMTPLDVLSSIFGSALAPSELEEALTSNGYDFERAMSWLVDRQIATGAATATAPVPVPMKIQALGNRVNLVSRDGHSFRGGRGGFSGRGSKFVGRPVPGGNRVCRYFLAGECLRADCRFSHDLERALCRFWLRGTCAKGENCEFLHHLPKDVDVSSLTQAMARNSINSNVNSEGGAQNTASEEFPALNQASTLAKGRRGGFGREGVSYDPGRTRFAAAVKKAPVPVPTMPSTQGPKDPVNSAAARRDSPEALSNNVTVVAPRPSPRLRLRPPTLLPTLPTGESVNKLYMAYRARAHQLGADRNACLARAAEAWKRGDGAAAKRFSRDGHDLNAKMSAEMVQAAGRLVRERAKLAEQAVRARDASWSDDVGDRTARGSLIGAGLGVCLGIASQIVSDGKKATPEERTEVMLDLHGLHATEATEVVEEFLLALEREHFYGLVFLVVGEEKHTGTQDPARGASRARLATGVREWLHLWGYPWSERDGIICVDPLTHA